VFCLVLAGILLLLGFGAELRSIARPDIGFLLDAASRLVDGATLYVDVVEINPPLIIVLNVPAVILGRLLGVSNILIYRLGVTLVLGSALFLSWRALGRAISQDAPELRDRLLVLMVAALFPLSGQDFGEREHLLLALVLPYLLSAAGRLEGRDPTRAEGLLLGGLTGVALALKPQFLPLWFAIEWYLWRHAPRRTALRPESVAIVGVLAVYGVAVIALTPQYLHMVALLGPLYGRFLYDSFLHLLVTGPGMALVWVALLAWVALRERARHPNLWVVLIIGILACTFGGAIQQKGLRYHFYPSFALALIAIGLFALDVRLPLRRAVQRVYWVVAATLAITGILVVATDNLGQLAGASSAADAAYWRLVRTVREHARGGRVYVMSYHIGSAYPLINYSGVRSASRFPQLWILAASYYDQLRSGSPLHYRAPSSMAPAELYLNRAVREDLTIHRPQVLVILRSARDLAVNGFRRLDYVAYFGRDPAIADFLANFQRIGNIGEYALYERIPEGQARTSPPPAVEPATQDVLRQDQQSLQVRLGDPAFLRQAGVFFVVLLLVSVLGRQRWRGAPDLA
jgi:hypothetical protein